MLKVYLTISIFSSLVLCIGTIIGYGNIGYAQNATTIGTAIADLRGYQNNTEWPNIHSNVKTDFNPNITSPQIQATAFIHPFAVIIGDCYIGKLVLVAPTAVCRGDEGTPIHVGDGSNMQDGAVLHALETTDHGKNLDGRRFSISGDRLLANDSRFSQGYGIYLGDRVSLAHDSMVHGPAWIGNDTFIGMKSLIFDAKVGKNVAVGISSTISGGVEIDNDRYVPPGSVIMTQEEADLLPPRVGSAYEKINKAVINVNERIAEALLAQAYNQQLDELIKERESLIEENVLYIPGMKSIAIANDDIKKSLISVYNESKPASVTKLNETQTNEALTDLPGWSVVDGKLRKTFAFKDFPTLFDFMFKVANVSQIINHHPNMTSTFNTLTLDYDTWRIGHAISDIDINAANRVESLYDKGNYTDYR